MAAASRLQARSPAAGGATLLFIVLATCAVPAAALELGASWTGDFATVAHGGLQGGERHLGLVEATLDHEFAFRDRKSVLHIAAQHVYGGGLSAELVGDLQGVSNIDADSGTRVLESWIDVPLTASTSLLVGRYDLNGEFDTTEPGMLFLSSSQGIGPDIAQTGAAGPSIFPRTALGVRLQHRGQAGAALRVAALDVEACPDVEHGDTPFAGGPMFTLEYEWPLQAARVKTGAWRFVRSSPGLSDGADRASQHGGYGSIQRKVSADFVAYGRVGIANAEVSRIGLYAGGGLVYSRGLLPGRDDTFGFAFGFARNGSGYADAMQAAGIPATSGEQSYELTWRIPFGGHLVLQPDVQYVANPDTNPDIQDALVLILRVEVAL